MCSFWRAPVHAARRATYDRCLGTLISALEGGIRYSVHLRPRCLGRNLAVSPSPRAHLWEFAAIVALRLNNVAAPTAPQPLGLLDTGTAQSRRFMFDFMFGTRRESADTGWLVIDDITGCFVLAAVADSVMGTWEFSQSWAFARIPGLLVLHYSYCQRPATRSSPCAPQAK